MFICASFCNCFALFDDPSYAEINDSYGMITRLFECVNISLLCFSGSLVFIIMNSYANAIDYDTMSLL